MTKTYMLGVGVASLMMTSTALAQTAACSTELDIDMPASCADIEVTYPFEGLQNFREITTPDGGIKPNMLFRSDQLDDLTEADIAGLTNLGIETIVDLRAQSELDSHPNQHIPTVDFNINLPIGSDPADIEKIMPLEVAEQIHPLWNEGKFGEIDQLLADNGVDLANLRIDRYTDFATDFDAQISRFMHLLADDANYPIVFHCAGGKDRTGFMSAVTLLTLGYTEDDVMQDYLTTNVYTYPELEYLMGVGPQSLRPAFGAHPEQMHAALQAVNDQYGSFENYRRDVLGISDDEVAAIRANLLTDG